MRLSRHLKNRSTFSGILDYIYILWNDITAREGTAASSTHSISNTRVDFLNTFVLETSGYSLSPGYTEGFDVGYRITQMDDFGRTQWQNVFWQSGDGWNAENTFLHPIFSSNGNVGTRFMDVCARMHKPIGTYRMLHPLHVCTLIMKETTYSGWILMY